MSDVCWKNLYFVIIIFLNKKIINDIPWILLFFTELFIW